MSYDDGNGKKALAPSAPLPHPLFGSSVTYPYLLDTKFPSPCNKICHSVTLPASVRCHAPLLPTHLSLLPVARAKTPLKRKGSLRISAFICTLREGQ